MDEDTRIKITRIRDEVEYLIKSNLCGSYLINEEDKKFIAGDPLTYRLDLILKMFDEIL